MNLKRLNIFIICTISSLYVLCAESVGGLLFTSSTEKVDKRTSMQIFNDKLLKVDDSFSISFDLSIWNSEQFGHIFRVINQQKKEVEFVFVNFYGSENMYLDFHSPITHKSVQIPITKAAIDKKELLHFVFRFNLKRDEVTIRLKDSTYTCSPVGLKNPSLLHFAFGLYGLNLDVPQMLIRNLHIEASPKKTYSFPLKEASGEFAYEESGKLKAVVKNPGWIVNKHFYWEQKLHANIADRAYVAYEEEANRILITNGNSIISYYPRNNYTKRNKILNPPKGFMVNDVIYDRKHSQYLLLCYDSLATYDERKVISDDLSINFLNPGNSKNLIHHNSFISSSDILYQVGGYENHIYSDKIYYLNTEHFKWDTIDFKGNAITPRFYSALGDGANSDEVLLFGGFGNESGKQEHGGHNLYDLYTIDLKNREITKLWELNQIQKNEFIPGNNIILNKEGTHFYAFCYAHHVAKTTGFLYRFNLKNGRYEIVSDSIKINSEDMNTTINLFFNKELNEYYVVTNEFSENNSNIRVYSLYSPPILKAELENLVPARLIRNLLPALFALALLLVLFFILRVIRKKGYRKNVPDSEKLNLSTTSHDIFQIKKSAIYIFGSFTAFDKKGVDISYRFSNKLKILFAIILLNTNEDGTGISTEKLTSSLWPEKETNDAKNIRGVTVNRLRNILIDIEGINLVHQNSQWYFTFNDDFYCDFAEYSSLMNQINDLQQDDFSKLIDRILEMISKGSLLYNIQDDIVNDVKAVEEEKIELLLRKYVLSLFDNKEYRKIIQIAPSYFAVEPINNEIFEICIKSYNKLGKKDDAEKFKKNYKKIYKLMTGYEP